MYGNWAGLPFGRANYDERSHLRKESGGALRPPITRTDQELNLIAQENLIRQEGDEIPGDPARGQPTCPQGCCYSDGDRDRRQRADPPPIPTGLEIGRDARSEKSEQGEDLALSARNDLPHHPGSIGANVPVRATDIHTVATWEVQAAECVAPDPPVGEIAQAP